MRIHLIVFGTLLLILVVSAGIGYSMWTSRLRVNVSIQVAGGDDPFIDSYKAFICCESTSCCDHDGGDDHDCGDCCNNSDNNVTSNEDIQCNHCHQPPSCDCRGLEDSQMSLTGNSRTLLLTNLECGDHCGCHCCHDNGHHDHYTNMSLWIGLVVKHEGEIPVRLTSVSVIVNGDYDEVHVNYYAYGPFTTSFQQVWGSVDPCSLPFPGYGNSIVLEENEKTVLWVNIELTNTTTISSITITPVFENWNT